MHLGAACHWADLTVTKQAGNRHIREKITAEAHIYICFAIEPLAATKASKKQSG
jgi:hypothetical protein